jgi:hypothetical protein
MQDISLLDGTSKLDSDLLDELAINPLWMKPAPDERQTPDPSSMIPALLFTQSHLMQIHPSCILFDPHSPSIRTQSSFYATKPERRTRCDVNPLESPTLTSDSGMIFSPESRCTWCLPMQHVYGYLYRYRMDKDTSIHHFLKIPIRGSFYYFLKKLFLEHIKIISSNRW